jgi:hypothetical protein
MVRTWLDEQLHAKSGFLKINKTRTAHRASGFRDMILRLGSHVAASNSSRFRPRRRVSGHKRVLWSDRSEISTSKGVWASRNERRGWGAKPCGALIIRHPVSRKHTSSGRCALAFTMEGRNMEGGIKIALIKSTTPESSRHYLC